MFEVNIDEKYIINQHGTSEGALDWLSNESPSFERDVLIYQLKQVGRRTYLLST